MGRSVEWIKPFRGHRTLDPLQGSGPDPGSWAFLSSAVQCSSVQCRKQLIFTPILGRYMASGICSSGAFPILLHIFLVILA
jgi:hypothetical protein